MGIEQISLNIANKIGDRLGKTEEEIAVINYGMFAILHTSLVMLATLIVGVVTNTVKEIIIISLCSAILKRYSGGVHSSSPIRCLLVGVSMCTALALTSKLFVEKLSNMNLLVILIAGILVCYFVLYKRCPIGSKQKPLKNEAKRKLLRKKSFKVMNLYAFSMMIMYIYSSSLDNTFAKSICISILFGAFIQIFALSVIGEKTIGFIDGLLQRRHND